MEIITITKLSSKEDKALAWSKLVNRDANTAEFIKQAIQTFGVMDTIIIRLNDETH